MQKLKGDSFTFLKNGQRMELNYANIFLYHTKVYAVDHTLIQKQKLRECGEIMFFQCTPDISINLY